MKIESLISNIKKKHRLEFSFRSQNALSFLNLFFTLLFLLHISCANTFLCPGAYFFLITETRAVSPLSLAVSSLDLISNSHQQSSRVRPPIYIISTTLTFYVNIPLLEKMASVKIHNGVSCGQKDRKWP